MAHRPTLLTDSNPMAYAPVWSKSSFISTHRGDFRFCRCLKYNSLAHRSRRVAKFVSARIKISHRLRSDLSRVEEAAWGNISNGIHNNDICSGSLVRNSSHVVRKIDRSGRKFLFNRKYYLWQKARGNYEQADLRGLTGDVVAQYPRRDNSPVRTEEILQILLRHVLRQAAHVQIRAFDRLAARSRVRHLENKRGIAFSSKKISSLRSRRKSFVGLPE